MPSVDPYVGAPRDLVPAGRLDRLRPLLWTAIAVQLMAALAGIPLVEAREDPTLDIPLDGGLERPAAPAQPGEPDPVDNPEPAGVPEPLSIPGDAPTDG